MTSPNRRTFLKTLATTPLVATKLTAAPKREIKKALKWHMILDPKAKTTLDKFRLIADCGFDGVEFRGPIDIPLREVEQAMAKSGMAVPGMVAGANGRKFSSADPEVAADGVKQYTRALEQVAAPYRWVGRISPEKPVRRIIFVTPGSVASTGTS